MSVLNNQKQIHRWNNALNSYINEIEIQKPDRIVEVINWMLDYNLNNILQA
jgi:hypothetical protein